MGEDFLVTRKVLITGASGYLGGRIALSLIGDKNVELRLASRRAGNIKYPTSEKINTISLNVSSEKELTAACDGMDAVIHLAALNEIDSLADPEKAMLVNGIGTLKLVKAAESARVKKLIYFSTAHVYGGPLTGRITEESVPTPAHPYAITHRVAEDFVLAAHRRRAVIGVVLRLTNAFGAPADPYVNRWTLLVNDLCRQAVEKRRMILRSSGLQARDFIPLEDVASAARHFLHLPLTGCADGLFNLGAGHSILVIDMAERIQLRCQKILGFRPRITRPAPKPNEKRKALDYRIDKLIATGFMPTADAETEIDDTLRFCSQFFPYRR